MNPYYFDWAATSPMSERSIQAYTDTVRSYRGNPSALHKEGVEAAKFLAQERKKSASLLKVSSKQIVYTSGATESNSIVLQSLLWRRSPGRIIISAIEHDSILQYRRLLENKGFEVILLKAPKGYVDPEALAQVLDNKTQMVCIMQVNNVLGTVQDIPSIAKTIRAFEQTTGRSIHIHCDAVQAVGKIPFDLSSLDIDSASFSAHKFQGPKGTGILYLKSGNLEPLSRGGNQENGYRAGTENIGAIAAMNTALADSIAAIDTTYAHALTLRTHLESNLLKHGDRFSLLSPSTTCGLPFAPSILSVAVKGIPSEVFTRVMYDRGFCISSGSACSNNAPKKGEGILAGASIAPEDAASAIRISFGPDTQITQIDELSATLVRQAALMGSLIRKR
jgi:cysteine desulfurase